MGMGGSDSSAKAAQKAEDERQAGIKTAQAGINAAFDNPNRKMEIADFVSALRDYFTKDLTTQKGDTDRNLKFALARGGLTGGSTQVDQQRRVGEQFTKGLLDVERRAQGGGAELEQADQDNRMRLISMASQGLDATTAASQSAAAMRSSLEAGKSTKLAEGLGDSFSVFKNFYQKSQEDAQRRKADKDAYGAYSPSKILGYGGY
jgi:hypothetical protein